MFFNYSHKVTTVPPVILTFTAQTLYFTAASRRLGVRSRFYSTRSWDILYISFHSWVEQKRAPKPPHTCYFTALLVAGLGH